MSVGCRIVGRIIFEWPSLMFINVHENRHQDRIFKIYDRVFGANRHAHNTSHNSTLLLILLNFTDSNVTCKYNVHLLVLLIP